MTLATANVGNRRQMYIINCMKVPKQSQLVQKNEKLLLWCAQVTRWCGGWTSSFENLISVLRNAPKRLRKTVTTWSTIVALISSDMCLCPWPLLSLPRFCLCTLPCILTPLLPLVCWHWWFSGCSFNVRICYSCVVLCLYAYQLKIHEMHLWAISENWFIIGWSTFSSLVKVKIHLHNSWQIYKKSNKNV